MEATTHQDFGITAGFLIELLSAAGARPGPLTPDAQNSVQQWTDWQDALKSQLAPHHVLTRNTEFTLSEASERVRPGTPLVTWVGERGWVALLDSRGDRVRVARGDSPDQWMALTELTAWMDPEGPSTRLTWLALDCGLLGYDRHSGRPLTPFRRLLAITHPERSDILAIFLYAAFTGLLSLTIPVAVQQLVNTVAFGGLLQPVIVLAVLLLVGLAIAAALTAFQSFLAEILQQRIFVRACLDLAHRLPRVPTDGFGDEPPTAFVNRFFDIVTIQKTGAKLLLEGSGVILQTLTGLLVLAFYHPLMLLLGVFLFGSMASVAYLMGRNAPRTAIGESSAKYKIAAWMEELVKHPTAFRSTAGRERADERADALVAGWVSSRQIHYRAVFRQLVAALTLQVIVNAGFLALGGMLVVSGELTLGQLVASEIIVSAVVGSFARLAKHFETYYDLLAAADKVGALFDLPQEPIGVRSGLRPSHSDVALAVHRAHPSGAAGLSASGLSLELRRGDRIVLDDTVSAAAASTTMDMLAGLQPPTKGYVTVEGRDLREWNAEQARNHVVLIRSPQLVPGTILFNLTLGRAATSVDQAIEALEQTGLLDEIRRLPEGLETQLGESGTPLSRSQQIRLEIARVLLASPSVVLLDPDSTALADPSCRQALDSLFSADRTWALLSTGALAGLKERCDRTLTVEAMTAQTTSLTNTTEGGER